MAEKLRFALLVSAACSGASPSSLLESSEPSKPADAGISVPAPTPMPDAEPPPIDSGPGCPTFGECKVSYKETIYAIFEKNSCTSKGCHGQSAQPLMPSGDPATTYRNLLAYSNAKTQVPYVNACSDDPKASFILDNLSGSSSARSGTLMPPGGRTISQEQMQVLKEWVKCGAPQN